MRTAHVPAKRLSRSASATIDSAVELCGFVSHSTDKTKPHDVRNTNYFRAFSEHQAPQGPRVLSEHQALRGLRVLQGLRGLRALQDPQEALRRIRGTSFR